MTHPVAVRQPPDPRRSAVCPALSWIRSDRSAVAPTRSRHPSARMATAVLRPRLIYRFETIMRLGNTTDLSGSGSCRTATGCTPESPLHRNPLQLQHIQYHINDGVGSHDPS